MRRSRAVSAEGRAVDQLDSSAVVDNAAAVSATLADAAAILLVATTENPDTFWNKTLSLTYPSLLVDESYFISLPHIPLAYSNFCYLTILSSI